MQKTRQSNFELLRILAMVMIIAHHFVVHSDFVLTQETPMINRLWLSVLAVVGKVGVNLFVMISGYFLIQSQKFKIQKVAVIWGEMLFYSVLCFALGVVVWKQPFQLGSLVYACIPFLGNAWWFASAYLILFIFSPLLNKGLTNISEKQYRGFLLVMFFLWSPAQMVPFLGINYSTLGWFVFLYALAGYIRLWGEKLCQKSWPWLLGAFGILAVTIAIRFVIGIVGNSLDTVHHIFSVFDMPSPFVLGIAVCMFMGFRNLKMKPVAWINVLASATFGIYLIHDSNTIRPLLWKDWLSVASHGDSRLLIPYSIAVVLGVFAVGAVVDLVRIHSVEKLYLKGINCVIQGIEKRRKK